MVYFCFYAQLCLIKLAVPMKKIILLMVMALITTGATAQQASTGDVLAAAQLANKYFMTKYADPTVPTNVKRIRPSSLWTRAVYYEGLMALYELDKNPAYIDYTDRWANFHEWTPRNGVKTTDADDQCCAQTYLERYMMTHEERMITHVRENLDLQMATGKLGYWTWIDATQMAMPVYSHFYKATGERRYLDHAMKMYTWSRDTCGGGLFNTAEGLWWRDADYVPPYKESDGQNCYWSRGSGWVYAALVRVMSDIGPKDKYYKRLKKDFILMSEALLKCQREDGLWNPSLVSPVTYGGKELTGTALFLYGMSWGITHKILKAKNYQGACDRAWNAMVRDCLHPDGFLGYVQGTGKDPSAGQPVTYTKVPDFEDYGLGCFLLGAAEYYKLLKK